MSVDIRHRKATKQSSCRLQPKPRRSKEKQPSARQPRLMIDGTKAFITGMPTFGTLIALTYRGRPMLDVIDNPVTGERWIGGDGLPTRRYGDVLRTGKAEERYDAMLERTSHGGVAQTKRPPGNPAQRMTHRSVMIMATTPAPVSGSEQRSSTVDSPALLAWSITTMPRLGSPSARQDLVRHPSLDDRACRTGRTVQTGIPLSRDDRGSRDA